MPNAIIARKMSDLGVDEAQPNINLHKIQTKTIQGGGGATGGNLPPGGNLLLRRNSTKFKKIPFLPSPLLM